MFHKSRDRKHNSSYNQYNEMNKTMNENVDSTNILDDCLKETNSSQYKNSKFDPKTFKPFDKVLVRDYCDEEWTCDIFSHIRQADTLYYKCILTDYECCIPYNNETEHLIGTTDEAPDYYQYWKG